MNEPAMALIHAGALELSLVVEFRQCSFVERRILIDVFAVTLAPCFTFSKKYVSHSCPGFTF
jgi:hypothetical protein